MATAATPAARIHPGTIESIFDHLILSLKADPGAALPDVLVSHYSFRWAADGVIGNLAYLRLPGLDGGVNRVATDRIELAEARARRLSPRDWSDADFDRAPMLARFDRSTEGTAIVRETLVAEGLEIVCEWAELGPPFFAQGPAPRVPELDIVSVLIEAGAARATIDGRAVEGEPFPNEVWVPWLGRPLSSCVVALGEILLTRGEPGR